jgi:hypothetical protein
MVASMAWERESHRGASGARGKAGGKSGGPRRGGGFRSAAAALAALARAAGERRGFAERRLLTDWRAVVGADVADACLPVRVAFRGGRNAGLAATLVVAARPGRAPEVQLMGPQIVERVNAVYGYNAVQAVRVTQAGPQSAAAWNAEDDASGLGMAEAGPAALSGAPPRPAALEPATVAAISAVQDETLRAALQRLADNRRNAGAPNRRPIR